MNRQTPSNERAAGTSQAARTIPDKPHDCGPHVDTWPILDAQVGDAPKPKADDEFGNPKAGGKP
jgi:hypothetical protein